jgi:hypothetical protein
VNIVAGQIQRDETLEENGPARPGGSKEDKQTRGRAPIRHHVQDRAEFCGLLKVPRGISVQGIEETGDAVQAGAGTRVERHVVEGGEREEDARVAWEMLDGAYVGACND